jgi:parallel beta-helix repeat protein
MSTSPILRFVPFAAVLAALAASAPGGATAAACSGVRVAPSQSIQAAVDRNAPGTTFCITAGVHRITSPIVPKARDSFVGQPGAVLNGAKVIGRAFARSGRVWVASGQNQRNPLVTGVCSPGFSLCGRAEDVFVDDAPLRRVGSLAAVRAGRFYFDYAANKIYIGTNPAGHDVEAAVASGAFRGYRTAAYNVKIRGLTIEKFANAAGVGAVNATTGWVIEDNVVRLNHAIGIQGGAVIRNNKVERNGELGISLYGGRGALVESNELAFNNYAGFNTSWEAGGGKFMRTDNLVVRGNYVHDNRGWGIGSDSDNRGTLYENNRIVRNAGTGIVVETSFDTVIRGNTIRNNGFGFKGGLTGAGIYLNTSQNVDIVGNVIDHNFQGIGIASFDRGKGLHGLFATKNNYVHGNTIVLRPGGATGLASDRQADYTSNNNRFEKNRYALCGKAWFAIWNGRNGYRYSPNAADWRAAGFDVNSSFKQGC